MIRTGEMDTETCPVLFSPVLFSAVLSSPALPSPVFSFPVLTCPVLSSPLMSSSVPGECCTAWLPSSSFLLSFLSLYFPLLKHSFLPLFFHTPVLPSPILPLLSPPLSTPSFLILSPFTSLPSSLPFPLLRLSGTWRSFNEVYHTHNPSFASPIALSGIAFETYQKEKIRIVNSNRKNSRRGKGPIENIHDFSSPFTWELPKKS